MADDNGGLTGWMRRRAAKKGKELAEQKAKKEAEEKAAAERAEAERAAKPKSDGGDGGQGGYGGAGDAYRKRKTEEQTGEIQPSAFKSSNQGSTGRSTAMERKARNKRLNGVSI